VAGGLGASYAVLENKKSVEISFKNSFIKQIIKIKFLFFNVKKRNFTMVRKNMDHP
jgi:hypothetical protein